MPTDARRPERGRAGGFAFCRPSTTQKNTAHSIIHHAELPNLLPHPLSSSLLAKRTPPAERGCFIALLNRKPLRLFAVWPAAFNRLAPRPTMLVKESNGGWVLHMYAQTER